MVNSEEEWGTSASIQSVEEIVHEKVIYVNELVCQLQPSSLRPDLIFCAIRDGSLKIINLNSEREEKSLSVSSNSLIELVAIEREMNPDAPILITCSSKDSALIVAKMDNGVFSSLKLPTSLGIDYGCGIGPKIVLSGYSSGVMAIVNQRSGSR
jgi:alpha-tubulin suppressor-like RCC1 family protein